MIQNENSKKSVLPRGARKIIESYRKLAIGGKTVITPYFMNEKSKRGKRVSVGKGTAEEIIKETTRLAKSYDFDLRKSSALEISNFMIQHEIGIDCSGFAAWVLNELVQEKVQKPIWKVLNFSMLTPLGRIKRHIRPIENISVKVLTDTRNSMHIIDLKDMRVGDMIRVLNGHHILIISEIKYDNALIPTQFTYVNSTMYNDMLYGIREGRVYITNINKYLIDQAWIDEVDGVNWIFDYIKNFIEDSRIMRLKVLA